MSKLLKLDARQILDSRGNPTLEVDAILDSGQIGRAAIPSGASTGTHEVLEKRDQDQEHFLGKGVLNAAQIVESKIFRALKNVDIFNQQAVDKAMIELDGTPQLQNLGGNSILAVSLAIAKAAAKAKNIPDYEYFNQLYAQMGSQIELKMPRPMFNILNGGAHTNWQSTDIQEFMIVPIAANSMLEAVEVGSEIYHHLQKILTAQGLSTLTGDEGGFAPAVESDVQALDLVSQAITAAGFELGREVGIALDVAASEFHKGQDLYELPIQKQTFESKGITEYILGLTQKYSIMSVEDGLAEDDWQSWPKLTNQLGSIMSVGDDLLVTDPTRIQKAIDQQTCNALLLKVNQVGSLTQAMKAAQLAQNAGWKLIISHRSGETEDVTIADLAVGLGADYIKSGASAGGERTAKYNQLIRIEENI